MSKIVVSHLKYKYPQADQLALSDVSFTVEAGEFIGLIGRNKAGKSTLCQALVGLVPHFYKGAYGGEVKIDGVNVLDADVSELSLKVGLVFQNPFTQITGAKLTVFEEIAFGLENMGLGKEEMIQRIQEAMALLDISHLSERSPFELSGGQMQRMAIASVIAMKPEILILDEPTSQLDPQGSEEVFKAIQTLSKQGMTVILAEHKLEKMAAYADRIILLDEGQLIAMASPEAMFSRGGLMAHGILPPVYSQIGKGLHLLDERAYVPCTLNGLLQALKKAQVVVEGIDE